MASSEAFDPAHDGKQLERMTFFSDAVFAIAMTLLVIEVRLPHLHELSDRALGVALVNLLPSYTGFVSSFLVIGRFWVGHHQLFGLLAGTSNRLLWVNLLFLLAVAFMPFPTAVFSEYVQLRTGVAFYTGWLIVMGLANWWLTAVAFGSGGRLVRADAPPAIVRSRRRGTLVPVLLGAVALAAGMVSPVWSLVALAVAGPLIGWLVRR